MTELSDTLFDTRRALKILLAEDHMLTRMGLVHALQKDTGITVVGEAENGQEAVEMAARTQPDVVLMDLAMPVMDGANATRLIKQQHPQTKVIILTSHKKQKEVLCCLHAGADAYCSKEIKPESLIQAINAVMDGVLWIDPTIADMVLQMVTNYSQQATQLYPEERSKYLTWLTDREMEVLTQLATGKQNRDIAESLNLSIYTVKGHIANIIQKLAVEDRTQAALKALKIGLVDI